MNEKFQNEFIEGFERQLVLKAKSMSNSELRDALLKARKANRNEEASVNKLDINSQKNLLKEGLYSRELKRRELLEWALTTGRK